MTDPSYDECLVEAELRARAAYSEPHRHYHDDRHLKECLAELDWVHGLSGKETRLLRWAILWHDSIYEPGQRDNEEKSAELARFELTRCGVSEDEAAEVARLVMTTKVHRTDPGDRLGRLMISIDLAILGSDPERYASYVRDVRLEYAHVNDSLWQTGRALVLQRLLDGDTLYPEPDFRARLESQARANMEAEIKALDEG